MSEHYLIKVNDKPVFIAISNKSLADGMLFFDTKQYETIRNDFVYSKKYYATVTEQITGIFINWSDCEKAVKGVKNAKFKSFTSLKDAIDFVFGNNNSATFNKTKADYTEFNVPTAFVDGSFNSATGVYGYGVVLIYNGNYYEYSGNGKDSEMTSMRNVAGEILGSERAIREAINMGFKSIDVYYDYQGIASWADGSWKRNKKYTQRYYDFIQEAKKQINIKFIKVKAHTGVELNEKVDKLAKNAVGIL